MYDITNKKSFDNIEYWVKQIQDNTKQFCFKALIGNKLDLESTRTVTAEEAKALAAKLGLEYFETSAQTTTNVDTAFTKIAESTVIESQKKGIMLNPNAHANVAAKAESSGGCC